MKYIRIFQQKYNLLPDGIIGPNTLRKLADVLNIKSKSHLAHFLGQLHHESGGFDIGRENLNYSIKALQQFVAWDRMTELQAISYGRSPSKSANQIAIANTIYGGKWGKLNLGNTEPNDGWDFRGNGAIQLTGRYNHQMFANYVKDQNIMLDSDLILSKYFFESGKFYFDTKDVWRNCNIVSSKNILAVSRHINLGKPDTTKTPKGLEDREKWTNYYNDLLKNITL